jgi:HEAT repeat protein
LPQGEAESSPAPRLAPQVVAEDPEPNPEIWEEQAPLVHGLSTEAILDLAVRAPSAWTRADALEELAARRSSSALAIFLDGLSDMDPSVRRVAADGLAELGNHGAVSALVRALSMEAAERTRAAMAQAITELQPEPQQ